ncbi:hypothetical protein C8R45DRAFT_783458, partial [Mycena sanguinolenta]
GVGTSPGLGTGTVKLSFPNGNATRPITLANAIHCPSAPYNLLSLGRIVAAGIK